MNCPHCGSNQIKVIDTRNREEKVFRNRRCLACYQTFKTIEMYKARHDNFERCAKLTGYNEAISAIERLKTERTV